MRIKFNNLDSIRTISFLGVFFAHAFTSENPVVLNNPVYRFVDQIRELLNFGVPVFFVLSGFLITYLMLDEQDKISSFSIKNFYIRRILRIWPVYFITLCFGFVVFPIFRTILLDIPYVENANWLHYVVFLSNFDQIINNQLPFGVGLGPTWSVSVEEQFYLFWPILLLIFPRKKFIKAISFVFIISILFVLIFKPSTKHTLFCFIYLSIGGLFAYLSYYQRAVIEKITKVHPMFFIFCIITLISLIQISTKIRLSVFGVLAIAILIAYGIVFQCFSGKMNLNRIPFIERLGKYTYGLYLYHSICIFIIHAIMYDLLRLDENAINVAVIGPLFSLFLSITISMLSYKILETKFLKLKERFSN